MINIKTEYAVKNPDTVSAQRELIERLACVTPSVRVLSMPLNIQKVFGKNHLGEMSITQFKTELAGNVEKWLAITNLSKVDERIASCDEKSLYEAWYSLDFYASLLEADKAMSLRNVINRISEELSRRGATAVVDDGNAKIKDVPDVPEVAEVQASESELYSPAILDDLQEEEEIDEFAKETEEIFSMPEELPAVECESVNESSESTETQVAAESIPVKAQHKEAVPKFNIKEITEVQKEELKQSGLRYIPAELNSSCGQLTILELLDSIVDIESLRKNAEAQFNLLNPSQEDYARRFRRLIGENALSIEALIKNTNKETLLSIISSSDRIQLLKAWISLDYYSFVLKPEYSLYLRNLRDYLSGVLTTPEAEAASPYEIQVVEEEEELSDLQRKYSELSFAGTAASEMTELKKKICEKLMTLDCLYAAYDSDYSDVFPFIGLNGNAELFTMEEYAVKCKTLHEAQEDGHLTIKKIGREQMKKFFSTLNYWGINSFVLDSCATNIELGLEAFSDNGNGFIIDSDNSVVRNCLLRRLQIIARYNRIQNPAKKAECEGVYSQVLNSVTSRAYTNLCNGVIYALMHGPHVENVTFYSEAAFRRTQKKLDERGKLNDLNLIAEGDNRYSVVESIPKIGVINIRDKGMHTCIFTDKKIADQVRREFKNSGSDDKIIAVTFEEVLPHALCCEGIAVDMPQYAYMISRNELESINIQIQQQK